MKYSQYLKFGINFVALSIFVVSLIFFQKNRLNYLNHLETLKNKDTYVQEQEQFSIAAKIQKNMPNFGFNNLLADWTFLQFIQYFGDGEARQLTGYSTVTDYFEDIVNRDPNFIQAQLVMSSANSLFAARPQETVDLMNQALERVNPKAPHYPFLLWTYKATDETLFLGDLEAAQNSYQVAAKWARQSKDDLGYEMARRYDKKVKFLASNPDPIDAQIGAWMTALSNTHDYKTQKYILNQLKDLGAEIRISPEGRLLVKSPRKT